MTLNSHGVYVRRNTIHRVSYSLCTSLLVGLFLLIQVASRLGMLNSSLVVKLYTRDKYCDRYFHCRTV